MEKVGRSMAKIILTKHSVQGKATVFLGKGHKAGDADALNLIAQHNRHDLLTKNIIVTPHPKELERLHPFSGTRAEKVRNLTQSYPATILYKGARTIISQLEHPLYYNTTGTPSMATGGQGDLLSGVIGALIAQGLSPLLAGQAGTWLTVRTAELTQTSE